MGIVSRSQGGGAASAVLFDSTLGAPANAIDTGAAGVAQTQNILEIIIVARTDAAGATDTLAVTLNNDGGANYDKHSIQVANATVTGGPASAATSWVLLAHGNGGSASYPSACSLIIPAYAQTTFFKVGTLIHTEVDATAGNNNTHATAVGYRSAAAISRVKVAQNGAGNLLAGSRLLILGR